MTNTERLIDLHFHKKPGENLEVLKQRYEQISSFHKDPLTAALLATSYYGIEELQMRLPRLNEILHNPFAKDELLHAITGLIILADGGPAEGAKAIQIYMALKTNGLMVDDVKSYHLISLLSICCGQAMPLALKLLEQMDGDREIAQFHAVAASWIREEQKRQKVSAEETAIAYALLVGMREEVETILDEEL